MSALLIRLYQQSGLNYVLILSGVYKVDYLHFKIIISQVKLPNSLAYAQSDIIFFNLSRLNNVDVLQRGFPWIENTEAKIIIVFWRDQKSRNF